MDHIIGEFMLDYYDLKRLVILANKLDKIGFYKEADAIDSFAKDLPLKIG